MRIGLVFVVVVVAATAVIHAAEAAEIQVGGDSGWGLPLNSNSNFYSTWAASQNFTIGDVLVFNFAAGGHDVAGVTKDNYENCNTAAPIFLNLTSPFSFTLNSLQDFYFICTFPTHCSSGQKFAITNLQQRQPSTPNSPPVSGDQPPATPDSPPLISGDEPPPPPPNSASSVIASVFTAAVFAIISAVLIIF